MKVSAGVVEGFYGEPWSHAERLAMFARYPDWGFDCYYYAPKDDPYHRAQWRDPYPEDFLARVVELAGAASHAGADFVYCLAPGLSMVYTDEADRAAVKAKLDQVLATGLRHVAVLFDDVQPELSNAADIAAFGGGAEGAGRAHGAVCAWVADYLRDRWDITGPLEMCPTDYAGLGFDGYAEGLSGYRRGLRETLPADARVMWTGHDVVVGSITDDDVLKAAESFQRELIIWDNFPVNDFARPRVFLGPLLNRPRAVERLPLARFIANPMVEAYPSFIPLATVGEWARDPAAYDPAAALDHALDSLGAVRPALEPLVRACASWPPSAVRDAELAGWLESGDKAKAAAYFQALVSAPPATGGPDWALGAAATLTPWVACSRLAGELGLAGLAFQEAPTEARRAALEAAVQAFDANPKDVMKPPLIEWAMGMLTGH